MPDGLASTSEARQSTICMQATMRASCRRVSPWHKCAQTGIRCLRCWDWRSAKMTRVSARDSNRNTGYPWNRKSSITKSRRCSSFPQTRSSTNRTTLLTLKTGVIMRSHSFEFDRSPLHGHHICLSSPSPSPSAIRKAKMLPIVAFIIAPPYPLGIFPHKL